MAQIVPLFGKPDETKPRRPVFCAECNRAVRRRRWRAWRTRTGWLAEKLLTLTVVVVTALYWVAAGVVLWSSVYLQPGSVLGLIVSGTVLYLMLLLLNRVFIRLFGPPTIVVEHRHIQEETIEREHRR